MSKQDLFVLAPYLTLAGGIVLMMLLVSVWRSVQVMVTTTVIVLLATLGLVFASFGNPPHLISGFLLVEISNNANIEPISGIGPSFVGHTISQ